jgi:hypothetical protein
MFAVSFCLPISIFCFQNFSFSLVKHNEPLDPLQIRLLRPRRQMLEPADLMKLRLQPRLRIRHQPRPRRRPPRGILRRHRTI